MDTRKGWYAIFLISMLIFCVSVWSIFVRPAVFTENIFGERIIVSYSAFSEGGIAQLSRIWVAYPNYLWGCVSILILSIVSGLISIMALQSQKASRNEEI